ncbi:hypothetical protein HA402_015022 [Bradysia odoriphaga]|nr:hypothetical protein HA402_015022 [Bradysia odoriphaga]
MCKITAVDVGMCLPKCFVIVVNLLTFLLGSLMLGASIFGMVFVKSMIGSGSLNVLFYGPIAFGGIIVFISFFGCCGACCKNRCMLMTFAILLFIIFACQVGFVYFVYDLYAQLSKSVNDYLTDTMKSSKDNDILFHIWEFIQHFFECCGVNSLNDWAMVTETLPTSCCLMRNETEVTVMTEMTLMTEMTVVTEMTEEISQNSTCTQENAFERGCKTLVTDYLNVMFHPLTVGVIAVLTIQLINLVLSCCMFFVYGWTNHHKNRKTYSAKGFVDTSPQRVHDQFIIKKDRF